MRPSFQNVNSEHLYAKMSLGMPVVYAVSELGRVVWSCSMSVLMVHCLVFCGVYLYLHSMCISSASVQMARIVACIYLRSA